MSVNSTNISEEIEKYILSNFDIEDDFLRNLHRESLDYGFPDIAISSQQATFLQFIIKSINAKHILEIGSLAGYSAIAMARALPNDGKLIAIEMENKFCKFIQSKVEEVGLTSKIEVVNSGGLDYLTNSNNDYEFDLIFVDADKKEYIDYFKLGSPKLRKGGIFIADNCLAFGEICNPSPHNDRHDADDIIAIQQYNKFIGTNKEYFSVLAPIGDGLLMSYKL